MSVKKRVMYDCGDYVRFALSEVDVKEGCIDIIDRYRTYDRTGEPSYDIYNAKENMLYKHIPQHLVVRKIRNALPEERLYNKYK